MTMSFDATDNGLVTQVMGGPQGEPTIAYLFKKERRRPLRAVRRKKHSGPNGAGKSRRQLSRFTGKRIERPADKEISFE